VQKTQTVEQLIKTCYGLFEIQGKEVKDCRLRMYDAIMKVRMGIYDQYEKQLIECDRMHGKPSLELEFAENGEFEEYDPNWIFLKCIKWEEGMSYDFTRPEIIPTQVVKIDPAKEKVSELELKLSSLLDIPVENLIIILRRDHGYSSKVTPEYYNMEWRKPKFVSEVSKFTHG
jgi:hypothetical protein